MSKRYKGAILSSTPPTTSASSASGVWTEQQFMQGVATGSWPALPGAPTIGTATAGALSASVTFTAPTYTGSGITGYTVTSSPGGITGTGASSPITVSGLTAGTPYTFTVTATTAAGQGPASAASNSVTPTAPNYIEDVFSTYLYTGNSSTQVITNGVNLSTYGGLIWRQGRSAGTGGGFIDTARGIASYINSSNTDAASTGTNWITSFNSDGFTMNSASFNGGATYASWTFREQAKFFDVVTYTGNDVIGRQIPHNLGSVPGCIIVKQTNAAREWAVYHTSLGNTKYINLNSTGGAQTQTYWNNTSPTSTNFTVGDWGAVNGGGNTYVAYLFAHNAGGFGLTGTDNVISCGSYTGNGAAGGQLINLGYEAQWVMIKNASSAADWWMLDTMRGWVVNGDFGSDQALFANSSAAEQGQVAGQPDALGFRPIQDNVNQSGQTYIYIAIRRGPMKVPTSGTSVFNPVLGVSTAPAFRSSNFNSGVDSGINFYKPGYSGYARWSSRLTGTGVIPTSGNDAESAITANTFDYMNGFYNYAGLDTDFGAWMFKRAPGFHDEVCYTGTGSLGNTLTHNLGVTPELMIVKCRSNNPTNWTVYTATTGNTAALYLNASDAVYTGDINYWNNTSPTSTQFTVGLYGTVNGSARTYVAYLFATCAGVSKVGSYTGTGALQTINCGFAAGARFVLIKRTDSTGDWYTYDSARGISSSNDPYLLMNSTAAEVTGTNYVDTDSTGFKVTAAAPAGLNASGGTYIFLAIA